MLHKFLLIGASALALASSALAALPAVADDNDFFDTAEWQKDYFCPDFNRCNLAAATRRLQR